MSEDTAFVSTITIDVAEKRKEPRLVAFLFCDYANSTADRKPNLSGIFDRITIESGDKAKSRFFMFIKMAEVSGTLELRVFSPTGKMVGAGLLETVIAPVKPDEINYMQVLVQFELESKEAGTYWFEILHQGDSLGGNGLQVEFRKQETSDGDDNN